jgi:predicted SAM-dependent methyltransferase
MASLKESAGLLIRAVRHPRRAFRRLSHTFSVGFGELTRTPLPVNTAKTPEPSSAPKEKNARIASGYPASFPHTEAASALHRKLNVGCGNVLLPGWLNIDMEPGADLAIDVRQGLPFEDDSVDFIYNEHFVEHLTYDEAGKVLREFWRCLRRGGAVRIATPDLDFLVELYSRDFKTQDWFPSGFEFVKTKGVAMNMAFRRWGHKYVYNEEDLTVQLLKAGFQNIERCELNKSDYPELSNLETRKESTLVLEAVKE